MNAKQLFKLMKEAERTTLLCVTAYIINMAQNADESVKALQLQLRLTTTRYATFLKEVENAKPATVKFLASAYNFAEATLKNYLRGKKKK